MRNLDFLKVLNSPFKPFYLKWYFGKTKIGVPYFLPRKWVKFTKEDCIRKAQEDTENPRHVNFKKDPLLILNNYKGYSKAVPLTIGFNFCSLGWKTKWEDTDYRFEWSPVFSFVFFKWQIALIVCTKYLDQYWTSWLYYERNTDKTKTKRERIKQCIEEFPQTYVHYSKEGKIKETIDYYPLIVKSKYL